MSTVKLPSRETQTITLPNVPQSSVVVLKSFTGEEQEQLAKYSDENNGDGNLSKVQITRETARLAIVSWNIVGDDDKPLPITTENLRKLSWVDTLAIVQVVTGQALITDGSDGKPVRPLTEEEVKKNLSNGR